MFKLVSKQKLKESKIPVEIIYNDELEQFKDYEKQYHLKPKPVQFWFKEENDTMKVTLEVHGERQPIKKSISRF